MDYLIFVWKAHIPNLRLLHMKKFVVVAVMAVVAVVGVKVDFSVKL